MNAPTSSHKPSIGFICPLHLELQAVRAIFDEDLDDRQIYGDGDLQNYYYYGRIGHRTAVVVSFAEKRVGPVQAAIYTHRLLYEHPSLKEPTSSCFLIGIAAGIWSKKEDVRLGDIVIATRVIDYTSGKINAGNKFESTEDAKEVSNEVQVRLPIFCDNLAKLSRRIVDRVGVMSQREDHETEWECPGPDQDILFKSDVTHQESSDCEECDKRTEDRKPREPYLPKVHRGLIATGNVVLKDAETREKLRADRHNNVLAVEMEASAVLLAYRRFIVIRGICDYADSHKNKRWQRYAAATAAACARIWIDDFVLGDSSKPRYHGIGKATTWSNTQSAALEQRNHPTAERPLADGVLPSFVRKTLHHSQDSSSSGSHSNATATDSNSFSTTGPSLRTHRTESLNHDYGCVVDLKACSVDLNVGESGSRRQPVSIHWDEPMVTLDFEDEPGLELPSRILRVVEDSGDRPVLRSIWVPHTRLRVMAEGPKIELRFSDCKQQRQRLSGQFVTRNGVATYETTYDANKPNVSLSIHLRDERDAMNLSQCFLLKSDHTGFHEQSSRKIFSQCVIMHRSTSMFAEEGRTLMVWTQDNDSEEMDFGNFSQRLKFEISTYRGMANIYLGYMDKLVYEPIDSRPFTSEPPLKVKNNEDGRPGCTRVDGGNAPSSGLNIIVALKEVYQLLSETIGYLVPWKMRDFMLGIEVVEVKTKMKRERNRRLGEGQVTIWTNPEQIRILILLQLLEPSRKGPSWIGCTLPRSLPDRRLTADGPVLQVQGYEAKLKNVVVHSGDYLSASTFLPTNDDGNNSNSQQLVESKAIKLRFGTEKARVEFEESIQEAITAT